MDWVNDLIAEQIVLLLAAQPAPTIDGTYSNGHDWCVLCSGEYEDEESHDTDCPWRMAREYKRRMNENL